MTVMKTVTLLLLLTVGVYSQSCNGRCGDNDASKSCQCNSECEVFDDCCSDYKAICYSCEGRCGEAYLHSKPCQCNDECSSHGNCCPDYEAECGDGGVTNDQLRKLTETLLSLDTNNVGDQITVDHQGKGASGDLAPKPYFKDVTEKALTGTTITALIALQDNYIPDVNKAEVEDPGEADELKKFLDEVMATQVMAQAESFLVENDIFSGSLRDKIKEIWFYSYSKGSTGAEGSSGFEHCFVGEIENSQVSGLNNWVRFYNEEQAGNLNYEGWSNSVDIGDKGEITEFHFEWMDYPKPVGGMFTGTSPEFELAVFTVCFLARPNSLCPVQMNNHKFGVKTSTLKYKEKVLVENAYFDI